MILRFLNSTCKYIRQRTQTETMVWIPTFSNKTTKIWALINSMNPQKKYSNTSKTSILRTTRPIHTSSTKQSSRDYEGSHLHRSLFTTGWYFFQRRRGEHSYLGFQELQSNRFRMHIHNHDKTPWTPDSHVESLSAKSIPLSSHSLGEIDSEI